MNKFKYFFSAILLFQYSFISASHNTSRYFPFLERPEDYVIKNRSHITPSLFFAKASAAFKIGGGNAGIPELWGYYDLVDVVDSLKKVDPNYQNPIILELGPASGWVDKSVRFKVDGKLKARGLTLNYEQDLNWYGFQVGAFLPIMHINASDHFTLLPKESASIFNNLRAGESSQLDRIRRQVQEDLGLRGGDWEKTGLGDLDLHLRWNFNREYCLRLKSLDLNFQLGLTIPTGTNSDIDYISSVSFMGNGHWSAYFDFASELELKDDWKVGFMFGAMYQFENSRNLRISVYKEPTIFSALKRKIEIDPGMTYKISPYLIIGNVTEGLDLQLRYSYLRHNKDKWHDNNIKESDVRSYLNQEVGAIFAGNPITEKEILENIGQKESLTKWSDHYLTLQLSYNSKEACNNWVLDPIIYAALDYQINGNGSCKTHQVSLGVELHF